ncbi:TIGR00341 family protein, partial [Kaistella sp.]|uniref:TIGR00341 family protein n=1 Tax=Kaistella sp. TaxID=2782235 RepID=UPI002F95FE5E
MNKLFNLHNGEERKEKVLENVRNSISFSGSNFWILACAIMVASIGLNVNSTAVVIGAMLISPLMGPIVGAGFALGIYDSALLRKSLKNLLISTLVGLLVSSLYFLLTPFKEAQSEILARTAPNIYDVLIAFFGGLVGVIAVTRVEKGNPIPGVAIATALMPPLCTAGYGLATGELAYFAGAMFLYVINCVFICIATFIIVKYLKYPAAEFVDKKKESRVRTWITVVTLLMIIPSVYFAYRFIAQQRFYEQVSNFITKEFEDKGNTIVYRKTFYNTSPRRIELAFLTRKFTSEQIRDEERKLAAFGITDTRLVIRQDSAFLA